MSKSQREINSSNIEPPADNCWALTKRNVFMSICNVLYVINYRLLKLSSPWVNENQQVNGLAIFSNICSRDTTLVYRRKVAPPLCILPTETAELLLDIGLPSHFL